MEQLFTLLKFEMALSSNNVPKTSQPLRSFLSNRYNIVIRLLSDLVKAGFVLSSMQTPLKRIMARKEKIASNNAGQNIAGATIHQVNGAPDGSVKLGRTNPICSASFETGTMCR